MSIAAHLRLILWNVAVILGALGTIPPSLAGPSNVLLSSDGLGGAAGGVVPWFDGKPIVRDGIASTPSSITALIAPKTTITIAHLPHQIIL